jgi:hypothetical protein
MFEQLGLFREGNFQVRIQVQVCCDGRLGRGTGAQEEHPVTPRGTGRPSSSATCSSAEWTWSRPGPSSWPRRTCKYLPAHFSRPLGLGT